MARMYLLLLATCFHLSFNVIAYGVPQQVGDDDAQTTGQNFQTENLVAWCIVPFDAKNRGPAERAAMVRRLGLKRVAYDWREKHIPEFEQEILEYKARDIEFFAFWGWHESLESLIDKHEIQPQIWQMYGGQQPAGTQQEKIEQVTEQFLPLVEKTHSLGLRLGIYNHGGWAGEPENMIAICDNLRSKHRGQHVGIVYNFHHGHADVEGFGETIKKLKPYLICLNINGMADPDSNETKNAFQKILPVGSGVHERDMIRAVIASGYDGPIGVLGHRADMDVEKSLGLNLSGLNELMKSLPQGQQ